MVVFLKKDNSKHYKDQDCLCSHIVQSKIGGRVVVLQKSSIVFLSFLHLSYTGHNKLNQ